MSRGRDPRTGYTNSSGNSLGGYLSGFLAILFRATGSGHQQRIFSFQGVAALQRHGYLALVFHLANQDIHGTGYGPGSTQSVNLGTAFITGNYRDIFGIHRIAGKLQIRKATLADLAIGSGQGQRAAEGTLLDFQLGKTALIGGNGNITGIGRYGRVTDFTYGIACHIQHGHRAADGRTSPCRGSYALHLGIGLGICLKGHIPRRIQGTARHINTRSGALRLRGAGDGTPRIRERVAAVPRHAVAFLFRKVPSLHGAVHVGEYVLQVHRIALTRVVACQDVLAHVGDHHVQADGRAPDPGVGRHLVHVLAVTRRRGDPVRVDLAVLDVYVRGAVQLVHRDAHADARRPGGAHARPLGEGHLVFSGDACALRTGRRSAHRAVHEIRFRRAVRLRDADGASDARAKPRAADAGFRVGEFQFILRLNVKVVFLVPVEAHADVPGGRLGDAPVIDVADGDADACADARAPEHHTKDVSPREMVRRHDNIVGVPDVHIFKERVGRAVK